MNSPVTGKEMQRLWKPVIMEFKGDNILISRLYYYCPESQQEYTDEALDAINLNQVYILYAQRHNLKLEEVRPAP